MTSMNPELSLNPKYGPLNRYFDDQIRSKEYWKNIAGTVCKVALAALATTWVISSFFSAAPFLATVITLTPFIVAAAIIYKQRDLVAANANQTIWEEIKKNDTAMGIKVDDLIYYSKLTLAAGLAYIAATSLAIPVLVAGGVTYLVMCNKISTLKKLQRDLQLTVEPPSHPFGRFLDQIIQP